MHLTIELNKKLENREKPYFFFMKAMLIEYRNLQGLGKKEFYVGQRNREHSIGLITMVKSYHAH